jgi:UDPglucose 6-dehydrogenase
MRDAPSLSLMEALWQAGGRVQARDPEAMNEARRRYPEQVARGDLVLCESEEMALDGADALIICTEWRAFQSPDFDVIKAILRQPVIFDGRNIFDPDRMAKEGIIYYGIGLGARVEPVHLDPFDGFIREPIGMAVAQT